MGIGFGGSQLTNVILSDIAPEKSGAASGANSTVRMIGSSLGVAIMSTLLSVLTVRYAVDAVNRVAGSVSRGADARDHELAHERRELLAAQGNIGA